MTQPTDDPSTAACNIGPTGRWIRLLLGLAAIAAGVWFWVAKNDGFWSIGLVVAGLFMIYEAVRGWCALRALGLKMPF